MGRGGGRGRGEMQSAQLHNVVEDIQAKFWPGSWKGCRHPNHVADSPTFEARKFVLQGCLFHHSERGTNPFSF